MNISLPPRKYVTFTNGAEINPTGFLPSDHAGGVLLL